MYYSFDIFDTCLVRKCGSPINFFDVLSWKVFRDNPSESERQEFVCFRLKSESEINQSGTATLMQIYENLRYSNPNLKELNALYQIELECESEMLVPVIAIKQQVDMLHKNGNHVMYVSDMYLPTSFLQERLVAFGFFKEGDRIYVSGDIGKSKVSGELYKYIAERELIQFKEWIHSGDDSKADVNAPHKLGIKTRRVTHKYSYFEDFWKNNEQSLNFKVKSIAAGLSRSIYYSNLNNSHLLFVSDIIAPFYASWTYNIFRDANAKGIKRLYFCARDGYQQYKVAQVIQNRLFPNIKCSYLYISRESITQDDEDSKLRYFVQEGLACHDKVAIVDTRSQGRTQYLLNELFSRFGYSEVFAYYFEAFPCQQINYMISYVAAVNRLYVSGNPFVQDMLQFALEGPIYEIFFAMNNTPRTLGYEIINGISRPVFSCFGEKDDFETVDAEYWGNVHCQLLLDYINGYIDTGLYRYSERVFECVCVPTLNDFFGNPRKEYLKALVDFHCNVKGVNGDETIIPFVSDESICSFIINRGRNCFWRKGTLVLILNSRIYKLCVIIHRLILSIRHKLLLFFTHTTSCNLVET